MSDDQSTTAGEVPPAPVPQVPAQDSSDTVTLKTPPSLLADSTQTPESDSEATGDEGAEQETEEVPEDVQDPAADEDEAAPGGPVVETNPSGQTVTFPDGRVVHTRSSDAPVSNGEWQAYEHTHQGDQLRYSYKPGDKEYSPYSDPSVPNSHTAQQIEREIASFAERALQNPEAEVSYMWNALRGMHEGALDRAIATGGGSDKVMA